MSGAVTGERVVCPTCGAAVGTRVVRHPDGDVLKLYPHERYLEPGPCPAGGTVYS